jgi:hypothetical protein
MIIALILMVLGIVFVVFRLMRSYKTNIELKNTVSVQSTQLKYQDELLENLTKHHTIDDTLNSLHKGDF